MAAKPVRIAILANASAAKKSVDSFGKSMRDGLERGAKRGKIALAGLIAGGTVAALAAERVASANARVGNILANMGMDRATARALAYAESLEKSLGIDEEVIKNTQAKLASFESLAKTADKAGGIFDRATLAAQDLAAAGFGEAESNAASLGRALQDPIKGLTALTRSGVTFNAAERDKIKALAESGKLGKAQNIIMAAIEKQVGGTAEATADSSAKIRLALGNVVENIGMALMPALDKAAAVAGVFSDWASENTGVFLGVAGAVAAVSVGVIAANVAVKTYVAIQATIKAVTAAWTAAQWALNAAMSANPIGLVVLAIVGLVAALVIAYKRSETFRAIVDKAFDVVKKAAITLVKVATLQFRVMIAVVKLVWSTVSSAFGKVVAFFGTAKTKIVGIFRTANTWLRGAGGRVINGLRAGITGAWSSVTGKIGDLKAAFVGKFKNAGTWLVSAGKSVIDGLKSGVMSLAGGIGQWIVSKVPGPLKGAVRKALGIRSPSRVFRGYGRNIMAGLMGGIDRERGRLKRTMGDVSGVITGTKIQAPSVTGGRYDFTGTRSSAGGNVYVTVNVPIGANPVEAGREVARVLRPYLKAGGTL